MKKVRKTHLTVIVEDEWTPIQISVKPWETDPSTQEIEVWISLKDGRLSTKMRRIAFSGRATESTENIELRLG